MTVSTCMMRVTLPRFAFTPQRVANVTRELYVLCGRMWDVVALWQWGGNSGFHTENGSYWQQLTSHSGRPVLSLEDLRKTTKTPVTIPVYSFQHLDCT